GGANFVAGILVRFAPTICQVFDSLTSPQCRDARMESRSRTVDRDHDFIRFAARAGCNAQPSLATLGNAPIDEERLAQEQILWPLGIAVRNFAAFERQLHVV